MSDNVRFLGKSARANESRRFGRFAQLISVVEMNLTSTHNLLDIFGARSTKFYRDCSFINDIFCRVESGIMIAS
jgi:hypothetical protein